MKYSASTPEGRFSCAARKDDTLTLLFIEFGNRIRRTPSAPRLVSVAICNSSIFLVRRSLLKATAQLDNHMIAVELCHFPSKWIVEMLLGRSDEVLRNGNHLFLKRCTSLLGLTSASDAHTQETSIDA